MKYKLPPLSDDIENHLSWYSDHKADRIRSLIQSYAIAALEQQRQIEAQGVPDGLLNVLDNFEKKERSPFQAYLAAGLVNELRTAMLASAPPAPQAEASVWTQAAGMDTQQEEKYVPCPHCGKNTASDNPSQWCPCPKQASVVQQAPTFEQLKQIINGVENCHAFDSKAEFLRVWIRDWTAHKITDQQAKPLPLSADRDARIAELERDLEKEKQYVKEMTKDRDLEKEKQYVKEMTKDRDHWMTVAAERALLLDKNRKVNKPLSDYEFDEIG